MLGDETIGDIALAEADYPTPSPAVSAIAEFSWSTLAEADFGWSDEPSQSFGWS